jgi:hypothetical protein
MHRRREQGLTLFTAIVWLIGTGVAVQLWLVTAALEALLAGHTSILAPAAAASLLLLLINAGLLLFVFRLDRWIRRTAGPSE